MGSCASNPTSDTRRDPEDVKHAGSTDAAISRISSFQRTQMTSAPREPTGQRPLPLVPPPRSPSVRDRSNVMFPGGSHNTSFNDGSSNPQSPATTHRPKTKIISTPNDSRVSNHSAVAPNGEDDEPSYSMLTFATTTTEEVMPRHHAQQKVTSSSVSLSRRSVADTQAFSSITQEY